MRERERGGGETDRQTERDRERDRERESACECVVVVCVGGGGGVTVVEQFADCITGTPSSSLLLWTLEMELNGLQTCETRITASVLKQDPNI